MLEQILDSFKNDIATHPITILLGLITLYIAWKIHKDFARSNLNFKQVEHVCNLIEYLNEPRIVVSFAVITKDFGSSSTGSGILFNIFELGKYESGDNSEMNKQYEDEPVLFNSKSNQILELNKYIRHPLTPRKIANALARFHNPMGYIVKREDPNLQIEKFVEIATDIWHDNIVFKDIKNGDLIKPDTEAFISWLHLKETSKGLKTTIRNWLIANKIHDNNMREDFNSYD